MLVHLRSLTDQGGSCKFQRSTQGQSWLSGIYSEGPKQSGHQKRTMSRIVMVFMLVVSSTCCSWAVTNPEGVDWTNPVTTDFVTSAYVAIYGAAPSDMVINRQAAKIKSRADRYQFAKWLMLQPEYSRAFGSPRGDYLVYHNAKRTKYTVAKTLPRGYTESVERGKAFGPAFLLKTFYDRKGGPRVASGDKPTPSKPHGGPVDQNSIVGKYKYFERPDYKANKKGLYFGGHMHFTNQPTRGGYRVLYIHKKGHPNPEKWSYRLQNGKLQFDKVSKYFMAIPKGDSNSFELRGYEREPGSASGFPIQYKLVRE